MTTATVELRDAEYGVGQRLQLARVDGADGEPAAVLIRHGPQSETTGLTSLFSGESLTLPVEAARKLHGFLGELLPEEEGEG